MEHMSSRTLSKSVAQKREAAKEEGRNLNRVKVCSFRQENEGKRIELLITTASNS